MKYIIIDPIVWILLSVIVLYVNKGNQKSKTILIIFSFILGLIFVFSLPVVANILVSHQENIINHDSKGCFKEANPKTLLVLAGGLEILKSSHEFQKLTIKSYRRIISAYELYKKHVGHIDGIVITGGLGHKKKEADIMAELLINLGVPEKLIHIDNLSKNTHQNSINAAKILLDQKINDSQNVLITSALHMKRAAYMFQKSGIEICTYSVDSIYIGSRSFIPQISALYKSTRVLQEILSYWYYLFKY